jgi:hypothetical protein
MSGTDAGDGRDASVGICGSGLCCAGDDRAPNLGAGIRSRPSRPSRRSLCGCGVLGNALRRRGVPSMASMLLLCVDSSHANGVAGFRPVRSLLRFPGDSSPFEMSGLW